MSSDLPICQRCRALYMPKNKTNMCPECLEKKFLERGKEIDNLKAQVEVLSRDITLDRLEAICAAEREGRCIVLPCKVGNTVYSTSENECKESEIMCFSIEEEGVCPVLEYDLTCHTVGIDVFLTREEAETALKEAAAHDK